MPKVHATAIVGKNVHIGKHTRIGPYSILEEGVEIGENCLIDSCTKIYTGVKMGNNNEVFHGAVIGGAPQDIAFDRRIKSGVLIGHGNIFREQSTVHRSIYGNQDTIIGNGNFIMATGHIAHDCVIEDNNVVCNGVLLAGHVTVGKHSFISGNVVVHQFCRIGDFVMIAGGARISQDCPHYSMVAGAERGRIVNINSVGLRRGGISSENRESINQAYKLIFWSNLRLSQIKESLHNETNKHVLKLVDFIEKSTRGICSAKKRKGTRQG